MKHKQTAFWVYGEEDSSKACFSLEKDSYGPFIEYNDDCINALRIYAEDVELYRDAFNKALDVCLREVAKGK